MTSLKLNATYYLYKILPDGKKVLQNDIFAFFNDIAFENGTFRKCFKGIIIDKNKRWVKTEDFPLGICVVKKYSNNITALANFPDLFSPIVSGQCASDFNKLIKIPNKINFVYPYWSVDILKKEISLIEPYLNGQFIKFSNNYGYENPDFSAYIPAFSHYSWIKYKGKMVINDVQGIFKDSKYYLTDPAIQSLESKFGGSDLGILGIIVFLANHEHNNICQNWKWIPKQFEPLLKFFKGKIIKRTTFRFEFGNNITKFNQLYLNLLKTVKFD